MPFYSYKCKSCDHEFETIKSMDDMNNQICEKCGEDCEKLVSAPRCRADKVFQPGYFEHLDTEPVYIRSRAHLKEECRRRGKWAPGVLD